MVTKIVNWPTMQLTERLSRQPAWLLVSRILREQTQGMLARLAQRVGLRSRARLAVEDFEVPDSAWARDAVKRLSRHRSRQG
jgi:hypothetical protein